MLTGGLNLEEILSVAKYFGLEGLVSLLQNEMDEEEIIKEKESDEKDHEKKTMMEIQGTLKEMKESLEYLSMLSDIEGQLSTLQGNVGDIAFSVGR